jgi:hypothetical protein
MELHEHEAGLRNGKEVQPPLQVERAGERRPSDRSCSTIAAPRYPGCSVVGGSSNS